MKWYKHVKAALQIAAVLAFLGIYLIFPYTIPVTYAMSFSEELMQKAFEEEFGSLDDLKDLEDLDKISDDYENEDLEQLTRQYMEMFKNQDYSVETFPGEMIKNPRMQMRMSEQGRFRYILPNGEYYEVTAPNGMITSNPVRFHVSSEVAAVITKDGESTSILNSWNFTEPGNYQVKMLFYSLGSDNYEDIQIYEIYHYFTIVGRKESQIGAVPAPDGFEIVDVKKDGIRQPVGDAKCAFLEGDGIFEIRYRDIGTGTMYVSTVFERDTIAPFLEFSTDITNGPVKGPVKFYKSDVSDQVYLYYNGNASLITESNLTSAGKYTLRVSDEVGNSRMYDLEIKQTYRIFETKTIILALIFLLGVGARFLLLSRDMKVI